MMKEGEPITAGELGALIRRLRKERGMTSEELAHRAGLTVGYVGTIERGARHPSLSTLRALSQAMGIRVRDLLGGHEEKYSPEEIEFGRLMSEAPERLQEAMRVLLGRCSRGAGEGGT